ARGPWQSCGKPYPQSDRDARCIFQRHRVSYERERAQSRHAPRCHGSSGEVSPADNPGIGLRGELRAAEPRAADGRGQPHILRSGIMIQGSQAIEAASPFEMRVNQAVHIPERDVRTALVAGDMGFLHSFTTGSTVDGPGVRLVAGTAGCMWRCLYCHNPATWAMTNGMPVTIARAAEELKKYRRSDEHTSELQ